MNKTQIVWSDEEKAVMSPRLLDWYDQEMRLLPWRENTDPYRVWVSEIMLQQTQVVTVIPYFHRFLDWFPTIKDLAEAEEDRLLKAWEGLGYYSRVRNMQSAAQDIMERFGGKMPSNIEDILSLKGIGPYTGGAIGSIAYKLVEPAIDGNVMRVYSRLFCSEDDIGEAKSRKVFDEKVRETMSQERPGDFNQALMDLGATVCTPTSPKCEICPLKEMCGALSRDQTTDFPVKKKKIKTVPMFYVALAVQNDKEEYLLNKRPEDGLLANMWTFPLVEVSKSVYTQMAQDWQNYQQDTKEPNLFDFVAEEDVSLLDDSLIGLLNEEQPDVIWQKQPIGEVKHVFSHRKWHLLLAKGFTRVEKELKLKENEQWVHVEDFDSFVFPKPQQKMVVILDEKRNK